ncbi:MAG: hypothetical protein G01um101470_684 [Parcubacteria group bacterium Gr01-1014_70]|nr:MAG: hypothetical protein G01um101470_684 [Parcubacteria group bacterium Gr01-1014_70]
MKKVKNKRIWRSLRAQARIDYLLNLTALELGRNNERRVVEAYKELALFPQWIKSVRLATREEDLRGIDVVFATEVGEIFVQLKESSIGKESFSRRQDSGELNWRIVVAIIFPSDLPKRIREIITPLVSKEYERLVYEKNGWRS